jgi:hypothetical protein
LKCISRKSQQTKQKLRYMRMFYRPQKQCVLKKQALTMDGNALIPAIRIAITQAEEAAVPVEVVKSGLFDGQMRPRI